MAYTELAVAKKHLQLVCFCVWEVLEWALAPNASNICETWQVTNHSEYVCETSLRITLASMAEEHVMAPTFVCDAILHWRN